MLRLLTKGSLPSQKAEINLRNIRIATINIRTLQDDFKLAAVVKAAEQLGIDVLALQEVRRTSSGTFTFDDESIQGWQFTWSGHKRKHQHGVALLLAPHVHIKSTTEHLAARIISAHVRVHGMDLALLNAYAPHDATPSEASKDSFYVALSKAKHELDKTPRFKIIPLGDFNATISSDSKSSGAWDSVLGRNNSDRVTTNGNGDRLLKWCVNNNMMIMNSFFASKRIHRETWRNPATGTWKRIDYICATRWVSKMVQNCRVYTGASRLFDTDHRLLVMTINFPTKANLRSFLQKNKCKTSTPTINYTTLTKSKIIQEELTNSLDKAFSVPSPYDIDALNDHITSKFRECVSKVCPRNVVIKKKEPWEDHLLEQMKTELRTITDHSVLRIHQKKLKERRKDLKDTYYKELADKINEAANAREVEKEFAEAKKYKALKISNKHDISKEKLKEHFQAHFSDQVPPLPLPPELKDPELYPHLADTPTHIDESPPSAEEIKQVIKKFKNGKSPGTDKVKSEGLKYNVSGNLLKCLVLLISMVWSLIAVPKTWLHSTIVCIYKKGLKSLAKNYRGLSIGANLGKILPCIILMRIKEAYEQNISESQFGFRCNRSTSDAIFVVKSVIEKYAGNLVIVYIDLTAAYDHIPRNFLFQVITLRTGAHHLVAILQKMYEGTTASIAGMKVKFDVLVGCRQGGQESPCLFSYYFDYVLKVASSEIDKAFPKGVGIEFAFRIPHQCSNRKQRQKTGTLNGIEVLRWILYADDMVIFCKNVSEAEQLLKIISNTCKRFGLNISLTKTKTQVFGDDDLAQQDCLITIDGVEIENVCDYVYLGHMITNRKDYLFTELRVSHANGKFHDLEKVLKDRFVNMATRRKILQACIRSRLVYATQACFPNEKEMSKLKTCWFGILRQMVQGGYKRKNKPIEKDDTLSDQEPEVEEDYSLYYTNVDLEQIVGTMPLTNFVKLQYLRYVAHVCRASNQSLVKKMFFAVPQKAYSRDPWIKISNMLNVSIDQAKRTTQSNVEFNGLLQQLFL